MFQPNEAQKSYIEAPVEGAYRVLAGPGSGKTATTVHRIDHLIQNGVSPDNILAVTFSKAMADELGERAARVNPSVNSKWICTIHALCYRILREEGERRNVPYEWQIKKFATEALESLEMHELPWKEFMSYVGSAKFNAVRHSNLFGFYNSKISQGGGLKNTEIPWANRAAELIARAHITYDDLMTLNGFITFDDMLCEVEWLLEDHPEILAKYQTRFQWVFVDEAQDTSRQAMRILTLLAAPQDNFTAIGDADQTIYRFAGATPEINLWEGFEKRFPNYTTIKMEINYRSSQTIVGFTNQAIAANYTSETEKYRKALVAREGAGVGKAVTYQVLGNPMEEADAVAEAINKQIWESDTEPGMFFVASRTRAQLAYMYGSLFRRKIPFIDKTGGSFWDAAHVKDLLSYMSLSVNRGDEEAFQRVYNKASAEMKQPFDLKDRKTGKIIRPKGAYVNHRWLGKSFLNACGGSWYGMASADNYKWRDGVSDFRRLMTNIDQRQKPAEKAQYIIDFCLGKWWTFEESLEEAPAGDQGRLDDLLTVVDLASNYETTEEFLAEIEDMQKKILEAQQNGNDDFVVVLSTIHRLKGLERPIVYVLGVMDGLLPHKSALSPYDTSIVLPFSGNNSVEDERRLFFVAVSRAISEVHLYGTWNYRNSRLQRSRFCKETGLIEDVIEKAAQEALETSESSSTDNKV